MSSTLVGNPLLMPTPSVIMNLICDNNQNWFLNLNLPCKTSWTREGSGFFISVLQKLNLFQLKSSNPGTIDVKINGSALQEKSSFKMLGLHFSSKLDWGSSIAKTNLRKLQPLFVLGSLFLLRLLFVSINQPYCLAWNFVISRLVLLAAIWICQTSYRNTYVGQLVLHLMPLLSLWLIITIQSA